MVAPREPFDLGSASPSGTETREHEAQNRQRHSVRNETPISVPHGHVKIDRAPWIVNNIVGCPEHGNRDAGYRQWPCAMGANATFLALRGIDSSTPQAIPGEECYEERRSESGGGQDGDEKPARTRVDGRGRRRSPPVQVQRGSYMAPATDFKVESEPAQDPQTAADPYRYSNKMHHRYRQFAPKRHRGNPRKTPAQVTEKMAPSPLLFST
jgi:hypothetical protein